MEYTKLGNTDITISKLCLGCMSFGDRASQMHAWTLNLQDSEAIIKHALDLGINFFDTANCYSAGTSEEYLGRAIRNNAARPGTRSSWRRRSTSTTAIYPRRPYNGKSTAPCAASARSILICTLFTASITARLWRKRWKRWTAWSKPARCGP